ncbi:MAG: PAS domain S-box protein [Nitrospirota bacterium]|nr:PAS domain S-box protein [Nitrospirota bacterium]
MEIKLQYWTGNVMIMGIILFPLISIADYFRTKSEFATFAGYRAAVTLILILTYYLNKIKRSLQYQYSLIIIGTIASAVTIEAMILSLGGHQSSYYAGMSLLVIGVIGLIPYDIYVAVLMAVIIYAIYLVPILVLDPITNSALFVENNVFLLSTIVITSTWRYIFQRIMLNEMSLQYELTEDRDKLEREVQQRTQDLYQSELWHRSLFENATDGIMVLDKSGIIVNVNAKACAIYGFPQEAMIGTQVALLAAEEKDQVANRLHKILDGETMYYEAEHYRRDGKRIAVEISAKAIKLGNETYIQSFQRDVTEKKKIQDHLVQSQKMESIGILAGGIAHDFNNVLTAILGFIGSIMKENIQSEKILKRLRVMERTAQNASRMVSQLLGFARKSEMKFVPLNLRDIILDTSKLLEGFMEKTVRLDLQIDRNLPIIKGDIAQLEQVLMNLVMNARDAMSGGGIVTIKAEAVRAGAGTPHIPPYIPDGEYVELTVSDTGRGIPENIKDKIFEPFFTTKDRGKGTGLGLSMVYGSVTDHQGYITVRSKVNKGTTFTIYFPVCGEELPTAAVESGHPVPAKLAGSETVLVVDDDENVLTFVKDTLESNGYRVLATSSPMNAIDLFTKMHEEIDLVITDVIMPLIDGGELMRQVRAVKPDVKVLTISAYRDFGDRADDIRSTPFLQKPFNGSHLLATIRNMLDTGKVSA